MTSLARPSLGAGRADPPRARPRGRPGALFGALVALLALAPRSAAAGGPSIAVPAVQAPAKSAGDKLEKSMREALSDAGFRIVSDKTLQKLSKKFGHETTSVKLAKNAGASFLVILTVTKSKKGFDAQATITDVPNDRVIGTAKKSYANANGAPAAGTAIGQSLAETAQNPPPLAAEEEAPKQQPTKKITAPIMDEEPELPPKEEEKPAYVPAKDEDRPPSEVAAERPEPRRTIGGAEGKTFRFSLGAGSQLTSAYTVTVGSKVTGLAYDLSPLMLVEAGAHLQVPGTGLGFDAAFAFVPVKYDVQVDPPVNPASPKGSFIDLALAVSYRLDVTRLAGGDFYVAPLLGFRYGSLSVDAQTPYTVVLSSSVTAPELGLRLGLGFSDLVLEAEVKGDLLLSYSESPATTGPDAGGFGLGFGGRARYWMTDGFGLFLGVDYRFEKVTTAGTGTRTPFADDPPLKDANVFSGNLRVGVGAMLAL